MALLAAPKHRESILKALSQVPIATTAQLGRLNRSEQQTKKASAILTAMEDDKLVKGVRMGNMQKYWALTSQGRKEAGNTSMKWTNSREIEHALAVVQLYFDLGCPERFLYEPVEKFMHLGKWYVWNPDCIFVYQKKVFVVEVQCTRLRKIRWERKWRIFNLFFDDGAHHFEKAKFQTWAKTDPILPRFAVIAPHFSDQVGAGFAIEGRNLMVSRTNAAFIQAAIQ